MKKNNKKRSYPIQFKVNEKEKALIEQSAFQYGGSVSEFLRSIIFQPRTPTNGRKKQQLAQLLCHHAKLINKITDSELRKDFIDLEGEFWLLTK